MSRQQQKSLLIDPQNKLHFNVAHESIHMKKVKVQPNKKYNFADTLQPSINLAGHIKIYYSKVEKESDSGISFNSRLFFLKDEDCFGYMSKPDLDFDDKDAKQTISLKSLRKATPKGKILTLQFEVRLQNGKEMDKLVERKWVLRMRDKKMTDAWTDIINYQVSQIPSRKSTVEKQNLEESREVQYNSREDQEQDRESKNKERKSGNKVEEPIANQRPEQDYISIQRDEQQNESPSSDYDLKKLSLNDIMESPIKEQRSEREDEIQYSPASIVLGINENSQESDYNSTNKKQSSNKERYLSEPLNLYHQNQFKAERSYYEQLQENFRNKSKILKQNLYLPSFLNYFRPYIDESTKVRTSCQEIDKKYEDFITFCELTAKQFIDIEEMTLNEFNLANRFLVKKDILSKDKLIKEMTQMHRIIFGKDFAKSTDVQALFLLFENILYLQLDDLEIIVPLMELKTLPKTSQISIQKNSSQSKICQKSLIVSFENIQRNLDFIYTRILDQDVLRNLFMIPMSCQVEYKGFQLFFRTKINENIFKINSTYDSTQEIEILSAWKNDTREVNLDLIYEKLGQALHVNPEAFEHQEIFQIKFLRTKGNQYEAISAQNKLSYKCVVIHSDLLPLIDSHNVVNFNIFTKVHESSSQYTTDKVQASKSEGTSRKQSQIQQQSSFIPSILQKKKQSSIKKSQIQQSPLYNHLAPLKQNDYHIGCYKEFIQMKIIQAGQKLDKFETPIIHPYQLNELLQVSYLNHQHLGKIHQGISGKNSFVRSIVKSDIAAECAKLVLFKKSQQIILSGQLNQSNQGTRQQVLNQNVLTLINLILGKYETKQTELIWKVLTLQAQIIYGVSIQQKDIHKGYFILALVSKLNIIINPSSANIEDIFKVDKFILAIKFQTCRPKPAEISSPFLNEIRQMPLKELVESGQNHYQKLIELLQIHSNSLPYFIKRSKTLYGKIMYLLAQRISPTNLKFSHLNLYESKSLNFTQIQQNFSLIQQKKTTNAASNLIKQKQQNLKRQLWEDNFTMYFKRKLREIQYKITQKVNFNFVKEIQSYIKEIKIFYNNHPFISELLEFLSEYYISNSECQKALECLKVSLSNMISICEGNTNHSRLAKCFIKIGLVYARMRKYEEALNQVKRSKHCLQVNQEENSILYAFLLIKMAKITLQFDGKSNEAFSYIIPALNILEVDSNLISNIQLLLEAYETQSICLSNSNSHSNQFSQTSATQPRSQHYLSVLERILIIQRSLQRVANRKPVKFVTVQFFGRFLKLILPDYFRALSNQTAQILLIYIGEISQNIAKKGGIQLNYNQNINDKLSLQQPKEQAQNLFYPSSSTKNRSEERNRQSNNSPYNIHEAFCYIKQQICKGSLHLELSGYMDNAEQILMTIKNNVRLNLLNKSQSRASSRMFLMSTRGGYEFDDELNLSSQQRRREIQNQYLRKDRFDEMGLQKLLDFTKEGRQITENQTGYSSRQRKFDSLMKAFIVLLGDGFMLNIFRE